MQKYIFKSEEWYMAVCPAGIEQQYVNKKSSSSLWHIKKLESPTKAEMIRWIRSDPKYKMSRLILATRIAEITKNIPRTTYEYFRFWRFRETERQIANKE